MTILAVDLAAKYSAACLMDDDGRVEREWDSWQRSEDWWVKSLAAVFHCNAPDYCVIEDLPHGLKYNQTLKAVCRLQGRIYQEFCRYEVDNKIIFVDPATWRNTYPLLRKRGVGIEGLFQVAAGAGYTPPGDLLDRAKGAGGKTLATKVGSDYCSAFLIARWAIDQLHSWDQLDTVYGTSRYGQPQKRQSREAPQHG